MSIKKEAQIVPLFFIGYKSSIIYCVLALVYYSKMSSIEFKATLTEINSWLIAKLPQTASSQLPSRGQVMVKGTINNYKIQAPLEPDGRGSHWLHIDDAMQKAIHANNGDTVELSIEATKDWPEPDIPKDVKSGLVTNPETKLLWDDVTSMARWEWLRWINSTANPETRAKRIVVSASKLKNGLRRPCCFNRSLCCVPQVSKNGALL